MALPIKVEHKLKAIDDAITRVKMIADGQSAIPLTDEEYRTICGYVYSLCTRKPEHFSRQLYEKYVNCIEERIIEKCYVVPTLMDKSNEILLSEVIRLWSDFKAFAQSIYHLFYYLDLFDAPRKGIPPLTFAPRFYFCKMVLDKLYRKLQEAAMNLIIEERDGRQIDRNLLKRFLLLLVEVGGEGLTEYYENFELVILAEAAAYYSHLSLEWGFWRNSFADYLRKVDWCLVQEKAIAEVYPRQTTKAKLLQVVKYILVERNANIWTESLTSEELRTEMQDLLSKYTGLSIEECTSGGGGAAADGAPATR